MFLCGERISYDIDALESDPATIIDLLRITSSEKGNWMHVACHYRRKGLPDASVAVIMAMLEGARFSFCLLCFPFPPLLHVERVDRTNPSRSATNQAGVNLNPAYLMLSGCEADLARKTTDQATASHHRDQALKWLRKVYGENVPASASAPTLDATQPSSAGDPSVLAAKSAALPHLASNTAKQQDVRQELLPLRDRNAGQGLPSQLSDAKRKLECGPSQGHARRRRLVHPPKVEAKTSGAVKDPGKPAQGWTEARPEEQQKEKVAKRGR
jgi:hypothetical protein